MSAPQVDRRSAPSRWTRRAIGLVGLLVLMIGLASCGDENLPLNTLDPQGPQAQEIQDLIIPVFIVAGIVFVLVEGAVLFLALRFRRRKHHEDGNDEPVQIHGNSRLEWTWTIGPAVILAVLAVFNIRTLWNLEDAQADATQHIEVVGQQWWWEFRYDVDNDGKFDIITANQMVMPTGVTIGLRIRSNDVIHSFWIPALNGKKDAVPGRIHGLAITADKPGIYQGQCTEYCGLSHGYMRMEVKALAPDDFDEWVDNQLEGPVEPADGSTAAEGKEVFFSTCASCHQINGYDASGESTGSDVPDDDYQGPEIPLLSDNAPNLTHLMSRDRFAGNMFPLWEPGAELDGVEPVGTPDAGEIARWLRDPPAMKPMNPDQNAGMPNLNLSQEQVEQLTAFLTTLK
ncbi:MAG TPA: cytochrome c oxidase subunit II [Microthrixaceae bacterium]|nr:cytochrome c oxidase subunit II [Microthrixaceae bacterium]